jgi:hypothetical protein
VQVKSQLPTKKTSLECFKEIKLGSAGQPPSPKFGAVEEQPETKLMDDIIRERKTKNLNDPRSLQKKTNKDGS